MQTDPSVKVLLVDDIDKNLLALESALGGMDLTVVRAGSGEEALRSVLDNDFAVILMDVQMPGLDGFETATLIRERDRSQQTPIIFLTAFQSTEGQVFQGYALGAVDFLFKPIAPTVLRSKVGVFVDLFRKTEQVKRQSALLQEGQRREHERKLTEEKRRWELRLLQEEASREKKIAAEMAAKAQELSLTIAERERAERQLRERAAQQAIVAELGQRALAGVDLPALLEEAVAASVGNLEVEFGRIMELAPDGSSFEQRATLGLHAAARSPTPDLAAPAEGVGDRSLEGYTLLGDGPVIVEDLREETRFAVDPFLLDHGLIGALCVIIRGRDRPYGTFGVFSARPRLYTLDDVHFLRAVANVLATAIQRKRDEQDLAAAQDELAVQLADMTRLQNLGARLSHSLELSDVLKEVLRAMMGLQGTDRGVLTLRDRATDAMVTAASVGFSTAELDAEEATSAATLAGDEMTVIVSGRLVIEDARPEPVFAPHLTAALRAGCRAVCSTPLFTTAGELIGTIATYFPRTHRPTDREARLVELYARQAAEFIDNARLYREIRDADRHKDEFLAMLAHELRNPLASLVNSMHILRLGGIGEEETESAWEIADRQVRHQARLIDDLLDVSRISNGKIQLRLGTVDLAETMTRAIETARPMIEGRGHRVTFRPPNEPIALEADADRLEQVLSNLLNNAAKYTDPGGHIELEGRREGDTAVVRVRDNGNGIAPELLPRVFDLFTQEARSLDRSQGGLGIGLTLVRRLVEMHGGSVSAGSGGVGRGSEFVVRLPLSPAQVGDASQPGDRPGSQAGPAKFLPKRVLVVDDNVDGARILVRLLGAYGHRAEMAHDGPGALEAAKANPPDVVLLDIGLPGMDGFEVARRLRKLEGQDRTLLVAVSGYGQEDDLRRSREAGLDHHLVKPVDFQALRDLLGNPLPFMQPNTN